MSPVFTNTILGSGRYPAQIAGTEMARHLTGFAAQADIDISPFLLLDPLGDCDCGESPATGTVSWDVWESVRDFTNRYMLVADCCRDDRVKQAVAEVNGSWFGWRETITLELGVEPMSAAEVAALGAAA